MPKVSIIVPIYNVEKYLRKCIDSLLNQDFKDLEIIAINDGSPDNSLTILKEYQDPRLVIVDKENGGYGSVLREGIKIAKSDYILVCDPDDYLETNAVSYLYNLALKNNSDLTIGAKYYIYEDNEQIDYSKSYSDEVKILNEEIYKIENDNFKDLLFIDPSPHSKLYRKELVKDLNFLDKIAYTDNILFYLSLIKAKRVIYTEKALSYYLINRSGNTMSDISAKAVLAHLKVFNEILNKAITNLDFFYFRMFLSFKYIIWQFKATHLNSEVQSELITNLKIMQDRLILNRKSILAYYKLYNNRRYKERIKDYLFLNALTKKIGFNLLLKDIKKRGQHD